MADEEKPSTEESEPKKGSPVLLLVLVAAVALLGGAGATYFAVGRHPAPDVAEGEGAAATQEGEPGGEASTPAPFSERLFSLEPFVVNVNSEQYPRFLKVKMELELDQPDDKTELEERLAKIRDAVIVLITSKRLSDVTDFEGKALLKEELLARINGVLPEPRVKSVLFTEFVVQ